MIKRRFIFFFLLAAATQGLLAQGCPDLIDPADGAVDVPVDATITWEVVEGVTGYVISIGTTPGGDDIVNAQPTGIIPSYTPELGLPDNTLVYVTITLFYFNLPDIVCLSQSFQTEDIVVPPGCTNLTSPSDGATDVNVAANINWSYVSGANGYILTIGTSPGLGDLVNALDVGNVLSYNLPSDLPPETEIYVRVTPYNENGQPSGCSEESFTTGIIAALPDCTAIIDPLDGAINVPLNPLIEWEEVPGATGYRVYIGKTPFENDILDGGIFTDTSAYVINFEPNTVYFIRIIPYNASGDALGCVQSSFSTILGCGPFLNPDTGDLETLNPVLNFPDQVGICLDEIPKIISATDVADGYRWYRYNDLGEPLLISEAAEAEITEIGLYRYEAYIISEQAGFTIECPSFKDFTVVSSEPAIISGVNINDSPVSFDLEVIVSGIGQYEFSLVSELGPYQDSNIFNDIPENTSTVYVRDINGCGITTFDLTSLIIKKGFPKFFTPNNDGINDRWQYIADDEDGFQIEVIYIYNRYGKLLKTLDPLSAGWAGEVDGYRLPTSDFWYRAVTTEGRSFFGHFTLKR